MKSFTPFDLLKFEFVSDPQISPAGEVLAYVRHTVVPEDDGYRGRIFLWEADRSRPFTGGPGTDSHPRWSADGEWLAFMSSRAVEGEDCGNQLWVLPARGGEALPLTRIDGGLSGFAWSPCGDRIAVVSACDPDKGLVPTSDDEGDGDLDEMEKLYKKYNEDVREITKIKYKADGKGFLEGKRQHVGVLDFCPDCLGADADLPEVRTITEGDYDHNSPAWSPDGQWIAVSACREKDPDMQRFSDIWVFPVGGGDPVKITQSLGPASAPSWSPDGKTIAYLGNRREMYGFYTNTRLWLAQVEDLSAGSFELVDLTEGTDVTFGDSSITDMRFAGPMPQLTWTEDGRDIYYLTNERGTTQVVRTDLSTGASRLVTTGDRVIFNADFRPDLGRAAVAVADGNSPSRLHMLDLGTEGDLEAGQFTYAVLDEDLQSAAERVILRTNEKLLSERKVPVAERFSVRASEGDPEVDCWILLPDTEEQRIPAVLQIHGGPTAMYAGTFFFEFQLLAAAGYAVVFTNPRGSSGYGEAFRGAIKSGWGDPDYADIMAGIDGALERYPAIDPDRVGVAGGSYGGYMTNWIVGHTDRFAAAVTMRCVSDLYSFWGASDIGFLWDELYGGHPWETTEVYRQQSPITYMGDVTTPTLVIHSEEDHRCPMNQSEQVFATLKKQGVDAEFVRYPGESHGLSRGGRPWHRIHRLERIREWFDRYL